MADDDGTDTKDPPAPKVEPVPDLDKVTTKHLADLDAKWRKQLEDMGATHEHERAELRQHIEELQEEREERRKAKEQEDQTKDSKSTMVLPPNDIPPQQPNPNPETKGEPNAAGKDRPWWKKVW